MSAYVAVLTQLRTQFLSIKLLFVDCESVGKKGKDAVQASQVIS